MKPCSMHLIPDPGQESEAYLAQLAKWPGACHDGINRIFNGTHPLETDALLITREPDEADDQLAWRVSILMAMPDRPVLHMLQSDWVVLYQHPAHRLWCGQYESDDLFQTDLQYMTAMIESGMPDALDGWKSAVTSIEPKQVRQEMLRLIRLFGGE